MDQEKTINRAFYEKVKRMRELQAKYFREHDKSLLEKMCKPIEAEVDRELYDGFVPSLDSARVFRRCVREMRALQRSFFAHWSRDTLVKAKRAEKKIDTWIANTEKNTISKMQITLNFGE